MGTTLRETAGKFLIHSSQSNVISGFGVPVPELKIKAQKLITYSIEEE